jgi:hypothetical protein
MKRKLIIGAACAALLSAPLVASAHNNDAGLALLGGIVGGLIGSTLNSGPAVAYAAPVYAPPPTYVVAPPRRVIVIKRRPVYVERRPVHVEYRHDRGRHVGWYR